MGIGESAAFSGESVNVGRLNLGGPIATEVTIAKVIRENQNDVRRLLPTKVGRAHAEKQEGRECGKSMLNTSQVDSLDTDTWFEFHGFMAFFFFTWIRLRGSGIESIAIIIS
jgi:hypothetical protein